MKGVFLFLLCSVVFLCGPAFAQNAQELLAQGRVDAAMRVLQQQITKAPAESYNLLCRANFELGAWNAGIPLCEKAVELAPSNGVYHLWLGRIYGEKADHSGALAAAGLAGKVRSEFERAVELDPDNADARVDLAEYYLEAPAIVGGGKDKARAQADRLAAIDPAMADWVRARIAEREKSYTEAEREYRAAIDASHGGARAWLNLAGFYRHMQRLDEMEQALNTMESRPVDHSASLVDAAGLLLHTGRNYPLAGRFLKHYLASETVEEAPAFKAYEMLGELFEKQGDKTAAAEQFRAALALAHDFRPAQEGLKRVTR